MIPLYRTLQGHPEAVVGIDGDEHCFKLMTHKHNLCCSKIDDKMVLVCQQVDDFAIAPKSMSATEKWVSVINRHATMSSKVTDMETKDHLGCGF